MKKKYTGLHHFITCTWQFLIRTRKVFFNEEEGTELNVIPDLSKTIVIILKYLQEKEEIKSVYWQENKEKQQVSVDWF